MDGVEAEGRTVNEATTKALETLGLRRDQVDVEILSQGRPRVLGFGGEPARVKVTPRPIPEPVARPVPTPVAEAEEDFEDDDDEEYEEGEDEDDDEEYEDDDEEGDEDGDDADDLPPELRFQAPPQPVVRPEPIAVSPEDVALAVSTLEELLRLMGVESTVTPREPETAGDGIGMIEAVLDVDGEDLGILIGRRGLTLASLQYVLNLIVSKQTNRRVAFGVDVDGYRRRREEALISLARRTASRVRGTGRSVTLEPMPPNERRIIHLTLAEDPVVMTVSIGEGEDRKVAITPRR